MAGWYVTILKQLVPTTLLKRVIGRKLIQQSNLAGAFSLLRKMHERRYLPELPVTC